MKKGQILICRKDYLCTPGCVGFEAGEEYTIFQVEDCLGDLMASVKDKNGKTVTWPLKQFEIDIHFTIK